MKFQIIGAHPDDPESFSGCAVKLTKAGHKVQFVSVTNGQSGHQSMLGHTLVAKRYQEAQEAKKRLGIDSYVILENNDGYLTTDIHCRESVMKAIRDFGPDYIFTHRPYDYHPDHRCAGQLVMDCSYLVQVPNFLPSTPIPKKMPVIFYLHDFFMKPLPLNPEIVVDIDNVIEDKLLAYDAHDSQVYDWLPWIGGYHGDVPKDPKERLEFLRKNWGSRWQKIADRFRDKLIEKYGEERGRKIKYAEAFEACEYGGTHDIEAEKKLFTFD